MESVTAEGIEGIEGIDGYDDVEELKVQGYLDEYVTLIKGYTDLISEFLGMLPRDFDSGPTDAVEKLKTQLGNIRGWFDQVAALTLRGQSADSYIAGIVTRTFD